MSLRTSSCVLPILMTCSLLLSACSSTGGSSAHNDRINSALHTAAQDASSMGYDEEALSYREQAYKRDPSNLETAISYSQALRKADYLNRAAIIMAPFANNNKADSSAKVEYTAIQLALGNFTRAEDYAQQAILQDEKNGNAYHYLGIALEGKDMPKEAENAFRKALELGTDTPVTVMNNLALNLATKSEYEEALGLLEEAAILAPNRTEIKRNLRIVQTMQEGAPAHSKQGEAPLPAKKPSIPK